MQMIREACASLTTIEGYAIAVLASSPKAMVATMTCTAPAKNSFWTCRGWTGRTRLLKVSAFACWPDHVAQHACQGRCCLCWEKLNMYADWAALVRFPNKSSGVVCTSFI
jgi:hypothetical protein